MSNFAEYITPEKAFELNKDCGSPHTLEELREMSSDNSRCQCGAKVWRYGGVGLCFSCTTGEADASGDYELHYTPRGRKR